MRPSPRAGPPSFACSPWRLAPPASGSPPLLSGLPPPASSPFPLSPHRRTYAQFTTGFARARLPIGGVRIGHSLQEHTTKKETRPCSTRTEATTETGARTASTRTPPSSHQAIAARNGNGHKPDAAIVSEHELLWDGLSPAVTQALGQPLDSQLVSQRKGRGGKSFDYLEGHIVIAQANRIFGYGGWGYELVGDVTLRRIETVNPQTGEVKVEQGYSAPVRVSVAGALPRTDLGVHPVTEDNFDGHDTAMKAAVTDGMKRAFRSFGVQFGNGFYGDQPQVGNQPQPQRVPAPSNGRSVQSQSNGNSGRSQANDRVESQMAKLRKRLIEIAAEQGLDEDQVRSAVVDRTGKSIDDLDGTELGPLVEAAANKLRQMQQAQAA